MTKGDAGWIWQRWATIGFLLLSLILVITSLSRNSVTIDEPVHALTGYSIIRTGDLRLVEDHPPLLEMWMGLPLALDPRLPPPYTLPGWDLQDRRAFGYDAQWMEPPIDRWLIPARFMVLHFLVLLCAVLYRWCEELCGASMALVVVVLLAFDPNIIAQTGLATLDVGVTTLSFATLFSLYRMIKRANIYRLCSGGFVLGLAIASKISALPLIPIAFIWLLISRYRKKRQLKNLIIWGGIYFGVAFFTLWATHLFQVTYRSSFPWMIPFPTYWESIRHIFTHVVTENRYSFLWGKTYRGGVWTYFPITFVLKTPISLLILLGLGIVYSRKIWNENKQHLLFLFIYPLIYLIVSLSGALNLGYRHLLPIMPFFYTLTGYTLSQLWRLKWARIAVVLVAVSHFLISLCAWPYYIPYFNWFAGGTSNGYRYLADSSVDWGQALVSTRSYIGENSLHRPYLSAFTPFIDPSVTYDIDAELLPPLRGENVSLVLPQRYNPQPGDYIISASTLRGLQVADTEMYNWFWHREPDAVIAGAMLHYHVIPVTPSPTWVAQCSQPVTPLNQDIIQERFGIENLRTITFDCTQSWLFPDGGQTTGWYVVHKYLLDSQSEWLEYMLDDAVLTYSQEIQRDTPVHEVYLSDVQKIKAFDNQVVLVSPSHWTPAQSNNEGHKLQLPVDVGDILKLQGVKITERKESLILWTMWMVRDNIDAPISLMAHLIDKENNILRNADSFGIPFTTLIPGDVFVQQHIFETQNLDRKRLWIETGVYRLDSMERFPVKLDHTAMGDRLLIMIQDSQ